MDEDALARDLAKMRARAYHMGEWTESVVRRYHALVPAGTPTDAAAVRTFHAWLFVPPTLWPFNVLDVLTGCLDVLAAGKRLPARLALLAGLLPPVPNDTVCGAVTAHEHHVQSGTYEHLLRTPEKFQQSEEALRIDPGWQDDWAKIKQAFRVRAYQDAKGIIRRRMGAERNLRPGFHVSLRRVKEVFAAAFDAFCMRWNLYGMQEDAPLLLRLAVNVTPYGTMIHIPAYWSFDPKRDIRWDLINELHRLRVPGRQGATLAANRAQRRKDARKLRQLDLQAQRRGLKGAEKHEFLCAGLNWVLGTDPRRISRLRAEFRK